MKINSLYPVIQTILIDESKDFYTNHFGFEVTFDSDWYVSLKSQGEAPFELALLDPTHPTIPEGYRNAYQSGLIINFEVDDVDQVYEQCRAADLPVHSELRSEDFGQRHFITSDPSGVLLDIIKVIPPSGAFATAYSEQLQQTGQ